MCLICTIAGERLCLAAAAGCWQPEGKVLGPQGGQLLLTLCWGAVRLQDLRVPHRLQSSLDLGLHLDHRLRHMGIYPLGSLQLLEPEVQDAVVL